MTEIQRAPVFSVCIPTYNSGKYLKAAIDSVLGQSYADFELLIQDDCSSDKTEEIVSAYDDQRISFQKNDENLGIFGNLNRLCERATGDYIKVLCADDVLAKHCLKVISEVIADHEDEPKLIAVKETSEKFKLDKRPLLADLHLFAITRNNLFSYLCERSNWGGGLAELCVERSFFKERNYFGSFDKHRDFSKDVITWFEMILETDALMVNEPLVYQRSHSGQARYKLPRLNQLNELFEFFYGRESDLYSCRDFYLGRKVYLERYLVSHYWHGLKRLCTGRGTSYLKDVSHLMRKYNHNQSLLLPVFKQILRKLIPIKGAG